MPRGTFNIILTIIDDLPFMTAKPYNLVKLDGRQPAFPDFQYRISFTFEEHFTNWLKYMTDNFGQTTPLFLRKYAPDGWDNDIWSWESNKGIMLDMNMYIFLKDDETVGLLRFKFPDLQSLHIIE